MNILKRAILAASLLFVASAPGSMSQTQTNPLALSKNPVTGPDLLLVSKGSCTIQAAGKVPVQGFAYAYRVKTVATFPCTPEPIRLCDDQKGIVRGVSAQCPTVSTTASGSATKPPVFALFQVGSCIRGYNNAGAISGTQYILQAYGYVDTPCQAEQVQLCEGVTRLTPINKRLCAAPVQVADTCPWTAESGGESLPASGPFAPDECFASPNEIVAALDGPGLGDCKAFTQNFPAGTVVIRSQITSQYPQFADDLYALGVIVTSSPKGSSDRSELMIAANKALSQKYGTNDNDRANLWNEFTAVVEDVDNSRQEHSAILTGAGLIDNGGTLVGSRKAMRAAAEQIIARVRGVKSNADSVESDLRELANGFNLPGLKDVVAAYANNYQSTPDCAQNDINRVLAGQLKLQISR